MSKYRVLFHLDEGSRFRLKLNLSNIRNLFADLRENGVEVQLVVNGAGVKLFQLATTMEDELIETLVGRGVRFTICENSLAVYQLSKKALLDGLDFVPSGIVELVKKQAEGWVYIKP